MSIEDRKKSIDQLIEMSAPNSEFFLMLLLAAAIVVPGLLIDNPAVIIGGMVVAPLLAPILTIALGIVLADFKLIRRSAVTVAAAAVAVILFSFIIGLFYGGDVLTSAEITSRSRVSLAYLIIAIAAGAAAAFALSKPSMSAALPGVAVSVALLPPLSVTGIGFTVGNATLITGSLSLFFVNLIGMQFAALVVYSLMGFYPVRSQVGEKLEEEEKKKAIEAAIQEKEKEVEERIERAEAKMEQRLEQALEKREAGMKRAAGIEEDGPEGEAKRGA